MDDVYEVEVKYRVTDSEARSRLDAKLDQMDTAFGPAELQRDTYFRHPCRNFKETDEALRIREIGDQAKVTYKGPKIDTTTKTRQELEFPIDADEHTALFQLLGFETVFTVEKHRSTAHCERDGVSIEICWDEVSDLGAFVELETTASRDGIDAARDVLLKFATDLSLTEPERRGYLDLLLGPNP